MRVGADEFPAESAQNRLMTFWSTQGISIRLGSMPIPHRLISFFRLWVFRLHGRPKAEGEKKIDLVVKTAESDIVTPEQLYRAPLATPQGRIVQVSSLASMEQVTGMDQIRHL